MVILQIPTLRPHLLWQLICDRPSVGRSTPLEWQFHTFVLYCESSYLADQVLADLPPNRMAISQIPTLETSPTMTTHMWQTKCRQIYPHRMVILQIPTLRAHLLWQFICGRPSVGRLHPQRKAISHIRALLWELIFGRPGLGRSTPLRLAISQIPTLRPHLLWQLICGRPSVGRSTPHRMAMLQIPSLTAHMWQTKCREIYPLRMAISHIPALLWELIFGWPGLGRSTPHRMAISHSPTVRPHLFWQLTHGRPSVGRSTP